MASAISTCRPITSSTLLLLCLFSFIACERAVDEQPQSRQETQAKRDIISLSPSITETLYAFGAGERLLGVDRFSDQIPAAKAALDAEEILLFGDAQNPTREAIVKAKPGMLLVEGDSRANDLKDIGDFVEALKSEGLDDILGMWRRIGKLIDASDKADKAANALQKKLTPIAFEAKPRVLLTYSSPESSSLWCVGKSSYQSDVLARLGGVNVLASLAVESPTPQISAAKVIEYDPDIIIVISSAKQEKPALEGWKALHALKAVKKEQVFDLAGSAMTFYGPDSLNEFVDALRLILETWATR